MKEKQPVWYKRKRNWIIAIVVVILFLVVRGARSKSMAPKETAKVTRGTVSEELVLSGEIRATRGANLVFQSGGTLSWVGVKNGDWVKKGQALEKLDTVILNASYQQSLSALHAAEANVNQIHDDLKGKDSTETFTETNERVSAEATHDRAYESMVQARKALNDATLIAPFEGLVTGVANESAGMNISPAQTQVALVDPTSIYFSVTADQTDVSRFTVGEGVEIVFDAFPDEKISGMIMTISFTPSTDDSGTVYPMRVLLKPANSDYKYKIGMTGDARFILSRKDNVLSVPSKFVKSDKTGKYLLINNGADKKYIETGIEGEDVTEVKGDISEGTTIYD